MKTSLPKSLSDPGCGADLHLAATPWCDLSFRIEKMSRLLWGTMLTEIGAITVFGYDHKLSYLGFSEDRSLQQVQHIYPDTSVMQDTPWAKSMVEDVWNIWQGCQPDILRDIVLSVRGTPFQISVWQALMRIPKGHVVTYGTIAAAIDRSKAVRAVGRAVGANPVSLLIPCHRVVPKSRNLAQESLGNYMWGSELKQRLLFQEEKG